jgi:hexokinase
MIVPLFSPTQLEQIADDFLHQLQDASHGAKNSLSYIKNIVPPIVPLDEPIQCMVVGGSIFETAIVHNSKEGIHIENLQKSELPSIKSKEIFEEIILSRVEQSISKIGLCFAYPLDPISDNGYLDGIFLRATKEHSFEGLIGERIGSFISEKIKEKMNRDILVSVANDTVCLALAGKTITKDTEGLAGGINGTGTNFAFFTDAKTIVNLESGNFNGFSLSDAGKQIDAESKIQNDHLFEKEVAGGYLSKLFHFYEPNVSLDSSTTISDIAESRKPYAKTAQDILRRSASLLACQIAGIYRYKKRPMTFVMEGSVYIKAYKYQEYVREYLTILGAVQQVAFEKIEHSSIVGASQLVI